MKAAQATGPTVRLARAEEIAGAGALTAEAYLADQLLDEDDEYEAQLRDASRRAREALLLVATVPCAESDGSETVVGTVTLAAFGTGYAEIAEPGELEVRMLAVAPRARGRGIAEALMRAALGQAVASGARRVVLSTLDSMVTAHRLYARLGFVPAPERDWGHEYVHLRVQTWTAPEAPGALVEAQTWPPLSVVEVDGWRVGLSAGLTRRGNSALPTGVPDDPPSALDRVEQVYADAGLPTVVRTPPPGGDRVAAVTGLLDARGYRTAAETAVLTRPLVGDPALPGPLELPGVHVTVRDAPDDAWLRLWLGAKSDIADEVTGRAILTGVPALYLTMTATYDTTPIAVVRVTLVDDWAALSCLVVHGSARRRGLARALTLRALHEGREHGARRAFLQVEAHNAAAAALYWGLGFQPADWYAYRERDVR
ncbi:GNAT family N-acetyltransferase [Cellulomonas sp. URHE0023]|uniref:GNAT family N-acetyltransferase n=1 Tax=Cellulomonas sp. URHE0023 TaxID=1380354 RepID=UPI000481D711|nr:GNAT family N-acetyltransferase [Cellulomonas sp. URHE0023]